MAKARRDIGFPHSFMPASRFVVRVFASTDAEIFFPASAKPRLMPDASMDESFFPRSGASNLPIVAPSRAALDAASAARCAALSKALVSTLTKTARRRSS